MVNVGLLMGTSDRMFRPVRNLRDTLAMMFEHRTVPLLSRRRFLLRQMRYLLIATAFVVLSLAVGIWGYMFFAHQSLVDAFLNASMILGGMGPIGDLPTDAAKVFAAFYALYSGIALLGTVAVILAPLLHRLLHALHLEDDAMVQDRTE